MVLLLFGAVRQCVTGFDVLRGTSSAACVRKGSRQVQVELSLDLPGLSSGGTWLGLPSAVLVQLILTPTSVTGASAPGLHLSAVRY
jgi:hypothetical protein